MSYLFIYLFKQLIFTECLVCARHSSEPADVAMNKTGKYPYLCGAYTSVWGARQLMINITHRQTVIGLGSDSFPEKTEEGKADPEWSGWGKGLQF